MSAVSRAHGEMIDEILLRGEAVQFKTIGTSMRWLIPPGSEITARGCQVEDIRLGDIVLIRINAGTGHKYGAHRVVNIKGSGPGAVIMTKGDSSPKDARPIVNGVCIAKVYQVDSPKGIFRLDRPVWRPLSVVAARLSALSGWIKEHAPAALLKARPAGRTVFPQILVHSILKRVLLLGMRLSRIDCH